MPSTACSSTGTGPSSSPEPRGSGASRGGAEEHLRAVLAGLAVDPFIPDAASARGLMYDVVTSALKSIDAVS